MGGDLDNVGRVGRRDGYRRRLFALGVLRDRVVYRDRRPGIVPGVVLRVDRLYERATAAARRVVDVVSTRDRQTCARAGAAEVGRVRRVEQVDVMPQGSFIPYSE